MASSRRPSAAPGQPRRPLTIEQVLAWADHEYRLTGRWPRTCGALVADRSERWRNIDRALRAGGRGLPGGSSLARLLAAHRSASPSSPAGPARPQRGLGGRTFARFLNFPVIP
jgi:hypothetical protein